MDRIEKRVCILLMFFMGGIIFESPCIDKIVINIHRYEYNKREIIKTRNNSQKRANKSKMFYNLLKHDDFC